MDYQGLAKPITTRLDTSTLNTLKAVARHKRISQTELIRSAIEEYLKNNKLPLAPLASAHTKTL